MPANLADYTARCKAYQKKRDDFAKDNKDFKKSASRDKAGKALSQTISIAATADILFKKEQMPKLLEWANAWNARMLPIRVFIVESRVFTATAIHGTLSEPTSSDRVLDSFRGVIQVWASVMRDLRVNKFIPEAKASKTKTGAKK